MKIATYTHKYADEQRNDSIQDVQEKQSFSTEDQSPNKTFDQNPCLKSVFSEIRLF